MSNLLKSFNDGNYLTNDQLIHLKRDLQFYLNKECFDTQWRLHQNLTRIEYSLFLSGVKSKLYEVNSIISARSEG